ncbi:hypothetical protein IFR05_016989, partial [Cadophora sp. M221]
MAPQAKSSTESRSTTLANISAKAHFNVKYPIMNTSGTLSQKQQPAAKFQVSPFVAKVAREGGELDQHYRITPHEEWESMEEKYNIS